MIYEIEYSKRRKTVGIYVERDRRVVVKAPEGFPPSRIRSIIEKKKDWISDYTSQKRVRIGREYDAIRKELHTACG